jgi:hypothetical protein
MMRRYPIICAGKREAETVSFATVPYQSEDFIRANPVRRAACPSTMQALQLDIQRATFPTVPIVGAK